MAKTTLTKVSKFRHTDEEGAMITLAANKENRNVSNWLRHIVRKELGLDTKKKARA